MSDTIELLGQAIEIIREKRRTTVLSVTPGGRIVVKAPWYVPLFVVRQFVSSHEEWVAKRLSRAAQTPRPPAHTYGDGDLFPYLGISRTLVIGNYSEIAAVDGQIRYPQALKFRVKKELEAWYVRQAKTVITGRVRFNADMMQVSYQSIMFSDTMSKWGSCTHDNRLQFNWRLVMAPMIVLNYVVIHELAHTLEKNHSHAFWRKVALYNPSYKQQIKWLHNNAQILMTSV